MTRLRDEDGVISLALIKEVRAWMPPAGGYGFGLPWKPGGRCLSTDLVGIKRIGPGNPRFAELTQEEAISMYEQGTLQEWVQTQIAIDLLRGGAG